MTKFEVATQQIADRVWGVLGQELEKDAITELQLRRAFTQALADALAEVLVQAFLETAPLHALLAADDAAPTASTSTPTE